ncbi:MAG TPA: hypothetical protein VID70_06275 [Solirubrobacteraceae bacterium]|jgi:hypothetical protein
MKPCVVQYLYVHRPDEQFDYPTSRSHGVAAVAARYMECALVQSASLCLREVDCDVVLVTNLADAGLEGTRAAQLLDAIRALGVEVLFADYLHRPVGNTAEFMSSQYVWDAIIAVAQRSEDDRQLWLMDADCVWFDPARVFAAAPAPPGIGCIQIDYPLDWDISGWTPQQVGQLAQRMGAPDSSIRWVGGELLAGPACELRALVDTCKEVELQAIELGCELHTEEHLLSLAGLLGRADFHDLSAVARRILTGPRHEAPPVQNPAAIGVWHLPAEKGLGFRRGAHDVLSGHGERLTRDLDVPARALKRFNIGGAGGLQRRLRDDGWIASQRLRDSVSALVGRG